LAFRRAPRELEIALQPLDLAPQPLILTLNALTPLPLLITVALRPLDTVPPRRIVVRWAAIGHAPVIADSRNLYKYKISINAGAPGCDPLTNYL
jgi:hypothetical protein